jgi:hypothetical protein
MGFPSASKTTKPQAQSKKALKIQSEPEFVNEANQENVNQENQENKKRGRGRPRKPVRIPNPKYKNTSNSKILLWNKIIKEQGHMKGGSKMPKKGTAEYLAVRKIYDEWLSEKSLRKLLSIDHKYTMDNLNDKIQLFQNLGSNPSLYKYLKYKLKYYSLKN